jgi:hypothetical protein
MTQVTGSMADLDFRTRVEADVEDLDFATYCRDWLPRRLATKTGELAARGLRQLGLGPLAIEVDGQAFTFAGTGATIEVRPGVDDARAVAAMNAQAFSDLAQDVRSTMGLTIGADVSMRRGGLDDFIEWEPVLRAMIDGRPVYAPGSVTLRAPDGEPLDLTRAFTLDDDDEEMAHFLGEAGFLHLRGWFTADEMARVSADIDRALPTHNPGDGRSWWARTKTGEHRAVRLQRFQEHSDTVRALLDDPRFLRIGTLSENGHQRGVIDGDNTIEALVKPIGVVEGISDVPWHKDCSLGRHSFRCCSMTVGFSVTDSGRESGEIGVVAGSHRVSVAPVGVHRQVDLPRVPLPTRTGDVTVHLSCALHMSRPPTARERRVMYTNFALPLRPGETGAGRDVISRIREAAPGRLGAQSGRLLGRIDVGKL